MWMSTGTAGAAGPAHAHHLLSEGPAAAGPAGPQKRPSRGEDLPEETERVS